MASSSSYNPPCAACKFLRRKCIPGCIFSPHFPPEESLKFANVHKIFGASNVAKLLNELLPHQRAAAASSLAYEAEARVRDPIHGCAGAISVLQRQVDRLQKELDAANAVLILFSCNDVLPLQAAQSRALEAAGIRNAGFGGGGGRFYQTGGVPISYDVPWNDVNNSYGGGIDGSN
ncbi:putative elongator complex protein 1 [Salvia divinorum]|uniref:Elongator complex protein 1 n=1 Tax=Salvia divinorum TaxID=28513 RepID=A0ABD1IL17_SALDI